MTTFTILNSKLNLAILDSLNSSYSWTLLCKKFWTIIKHTICHQHNFPHSLDSILATFNSYSHYSGQLSPSTSLIIQNNSLATPSNNSSFWTISYYAGERKPLQLSTSIMFETGTTLNNSRLLPCLKLGPLWIIPSFWTTHTIQLMIILLSGGQHTNVHNSHHSATLFNKLLTQDPYLWQIFSTSNNSGLPE